LLTLRPAQLPRDHDTGNGSDTLRWLSKDQFTTVHAQRSFALPGRCW
jgi:hypothetical protein